MRTLSEFKIKGRKREVGRLQKSAGSDLVIGFHEYEGDLFLDILIESRTCFRADGSPMPLQWVGLRQDNIPAFFAAVDKARAVFEAGEALDQQTLEEE